MPRSDPRPARTRGRTPLAGLRVQHELTQKQVAAAVGISIASYQRLERGNVAHPDLRVLVNLAMLYRVELDEVLEDRWLRWHPFDRTGAPRPPASIDAIRARRR